MNAHPIPAAALAHHMAIVGKTGSGKTFAAKGMVELLLAGGARTVIVDPTGVWYGLRLARDGRCASPFKIPVFGGHHADLHALLEGNRCLTRTDLARRCRWEPTSGHVKNVIGSLSTLEIVQYPEPGLVELQDWVR